MNKDLEHQTNMKRRSLLKTFAASGISTALLRSSPLLTGMLMSRHADAQTSSGPNKCVTIYIPGGGIHDMWAPQGTGEDMSLGAMSALYEPVKRNVIFCLT